MVLGLSGKRVVSMQITYGKSDRSSAGNDGSGGDKGHDGAVE